MLLSSFIELSYGLVEMGNPSTSVFQDDCPLFFVSLLSIVK